MLAPAALRAAACHASGLHGDELTLMVYLPNTCPVREIRSKDCSRIKAFAEFAGAKTAERICSAVQVLLGPPAKSNHTTATLRGPGATAAAAGPARAATHRAVNIPRVAGARPANLVPFAFSRRQLCRGHRRYLNFAGCDLSSGRPGPRTRAVVLVGNPCSAEWCRGHAAFGSDSRNREPTVENDGAVQTDCHRDAPSVHTKALSDCGDPSCRGTPNPTHRPDTRGTRRR